MLRHFAALVREWMLNGPTRARGLRGAPGTESPFEVSVNILYPVTLLSLPIGNDVLNECFPFLVI